MITRVHAVISTAIHYLAELNPKIKLITALAVGALTLFGAWYLHTSWKRKPIVPKEAPIYFITFDKGDFNALLKISEKYAGAKILTLGTSATAAKELNLKNAVTIKDLGSRIDVDEKWPREKLLDDIVVDKSLQALFKIHETAKRHIMFIGVASIIQKQFALRAIELLGNKLDLNVVWDNFNVDLTSPYGRTGFEVQKDFPRVFVPNAQVAKVLDSRGERAIVSGSPAFDDLKTKVDKLKQEFEKPDSDARMNLLKKHGLDSTKAIIVYFGGADPAYIKSGLPLLAECLQAKGITGDPQIIVLPHPKVKADKLEEAALNKLRTAYKVNVNYNLTNEEAIVLSEVVLTFNSSLGDFARYLGKPVMFIAPRTSPTVPNLESAGLALSCASPEEFIKGIDRIGSEPDGSGDEPASDLHRDISGEIVSGSLAKILAVVPPVS